VLPGYTKQEGDEAQLTPMAEAAARQALSIDPKIGEAHAVLAQLNAQRGDLLDAESGFFFAISLEPNEATPHQWYSLLLSRVGRIELALEQARRAQELDPTSPVIALNLANMYLIKGEDQQAARYARVAQELGLAKGIEDLEVTIAMRQKRWDDARRLIVRQQELPPELRPLAASFVDAVANPALRPKLIAGMRAVDPKIATQTDFVHPYLQLGQVDLVYGILLGALDEQASGWNEKWDLTLAWGPDGAEFRRDPRFGELAERMGFVDYWKQYGYPDGCRAGDTTPIVCS
jgi:tetratricopeptide (TPR) repeat protein